MRYAFLITLLFLSARVRSQDFEGQISGMVDSIVSVRQQLTQEVDYSGITDSVEYAVVSNYVNQRIQEGKYSWPFWYLQWNADSKAKSKNISPYPTETGKYLLQHKYHISMEGVSNDCVWQRPFVLHDSLMATAIQRRHGDDFFTRYALEADELDERGSGLNLPFLKRGQTTEELCQTFRYADTAKNANGSYEPLYLVVDFVGDTVKQAYWGRAFLGAVQFSQERFKPEEKLTEKVRAFEWQGPRFNSRPASATVVFDFSRKSLCFK